MNSFMNMKFDDAALFGDDYVGTQLVTLDDINQKLDEVLVLLRALGAQSREVGSKQIPPKSAECITNGAVGAPKKGSMLGEIQSALAAQVMAGSSPSGDVVSDACTLPLGAYDDNI